MILADTNVVSELMRDRPDPKVLGWARALDPAELTICVVTVEEIERGLGRLPEGRRGRELETRWSRQVEAFADTIAVYDLDAARIIIHAEQSGRPMSLADAQIGGICLSRNWQVATRNRRDFVQVPGLTMMNPFG